MDPPAHTHTPFFTRTCPESAQGSVTQHSDPPESYLTIIMALYVRFGAWLVSQWAFEPQWLQSVNKNSCPSFQQKLTCSASYMRVSVPWARVVSGDRLPVSPLEEDGALTQQEDSEQTSGCGLGGQLISGPQKLKGHPARP